MYKVYYGTLYSGPLVTIYAGYAWKEKFLLYDSASTDNENVIYEPVLHREANAAGYFEAVIPKVNDCWDKLALVIGHVEIERDGEVIWQGRIMEIETDFDLSKHIYCEGELSYLNDSYTDIDWAEIRTEDSSGKIVYDWNKFFLEHCEGLSSYDGKGRDIYTDTSFISEEAKQYITDKLYDVQPVLNDDAVHISVYDALINNFLNGMMAPFKDKIYLYIKREVVGKITDPSFGYEADIYRRVLQFAILYTPEESTEETLLCGDLPLTKQTIEFGKNLLDLTVTQKTGDMVNTVVAFGYETTGWWIFSSTKPIYGTARDEEDIAKHDVIAYGFSVDGVKSTEESLTLQAQKKLDEFKNRYPVEYSVKAIDLVDTGENLDRLDYLKRTQVVSSPHNVDKIMLCTSLTEPLDDATGKEFVFDAEQTSLSKIQATTDTVASRSYNMSFTTKNYVTKS